MCSVQEIKTILEAFELEEEEEARAIKLIRSQDFDGLIESGILKKKQIEKVREKIKNLSIKPNMIFTRYLMTEGPHKSVECAVMGNCGNGKTSLINNLCGTNHKVGEALLSITRNIEQSKVIPYDEKFIIYDTPGTNSTVQAPLHATLLRTVLTYRPLNVVFIQAKYGSRAIDFILELFKCMNMIQKYANNVVLLVSHIDTSPNPQELIRQTLMFMSEKKMDQQVIFYSNTHTRPETIAKTLYLTATNYQKVRISIHQNEFLLKFNLGVIDEFFRKEYEESLEEMEQLTNMFIQCALELPNDDEREQIVQELALNLKYSLQDLLDKFTVQLKNCMTELEYYSKFYALQKTILDSDAKFYDRTKYLYRYNYFARQDKKNDIRDLIKACPSCSLIWFRTQACPNATCGNRPSAFWDWISRPFCKYIIRRKGKKITIQKNKTQQPVNEVQISHHTNTAQYQQKAKTQRVGCGAPMNFDKLPRLSNIDEILKDWYNVADINELRGKMEAEQSFKKTRAKTEAIAQEYVSKFEY